MDDIGLAYVCHTFERFSKICLSLVSLETQLKIAFLNFLWYLQGLVVNQLAKEKKPSVYLLKNIISSYWRLSTHPRYLKLLRNFWIFYFLTFNHFQCFRYFTWSIASSIERWNICICSSIRSSFEWSFMFDAAKFGIPARSEMPCISKFCKFIVNQKNVILETWYDC